MILLSYVPPSNWFSCTLEPSFVAISTASTGKNDTLPTVFVHLKRWSFGEKGHDPEILLILVVSVLC